MELKSRISSSNFIEIKADELEVNIFEIYEAEQLIFNLFSIIADFTGTDLHDYINELE